MGTGGGNPQGTGVCNWLPPPNCTDAAEHALKKVHAIMKAIVIREDTRMVNS